MGLILTPIKTMAQGRNSIYVHGLSQIQVWWNILLCWLRCLIIDKVFLIFSFGIVYRLPTLVHHLGVTKAAAFVAAVDPWRFPLDDAPATIDVKCQVQSVVTKATFLGIKLSNFTDTSISAFLLSPLLVKKGDRPSLVLKPKNIRGKSSPKAVVTAAATVARKPSSQPVDLPIIEGIHLQKSSRIIFCSFSLLFLHLLLLHV